MNSVLFLKESESTSRQLLAIIPYTVTNHGVLVTTPGGTSPFCVAYLDNNECCFNSETYTVSFSIKVNKAFTFVGNGTQLSLIHVTKQQSQARATL